jgi:hypothetical protein
VGELQAFEDEEPEDNYKGSEGWVVVAVGERGRACYLAVDPGFGALRWWIAESGLDDPADADLVPDGDEGIFRARARVWQSRCPEGETDMGFTVIGEWEEVTWPLPA